MTTDTPVNMFVENLPNITSNYKYTPSEPLNSVNAGLFQMWTILGSPSTPFSAVQTFFSTFNASNPLPTDFPTLVRKLYAYAAPGGVYTYSTQIINSTIFGATPPTLTQLQQSLLNAFANTEFASSVNGASQFVNSSDSVGIIPPGTDYSSQFKAWYIQFASNYDYSQTFVQNFTNALTLTAALQNGTDLKTNFGTPLLNSANIPRYEQIYSLFFPGSTHAQFVTYMQNYIHAQVSANGFFVPSLSFDDFTYALIKVTAPQSVLDLASLTGVSSQKTLILFEIYNLISKVLGSLQNISAAQSGRLKVFSQWQRAYTGLIAQLHTFLRFEPGVRISNNDIDNAADVRTALNDKYNASIQSLLSSNQSVIGDDAKALQSNINSSTDAVSQQANMATAIIQELTTILGAIFK